MADNTFKGIWVFAEQEGGTLSDTVLELLAKALDLKKQMGGGDEVTAVLLGGSVASLVQKLFAYGAEHVILAENPVLEKYSCRPYQKVLTQLAVKHSPSILLLPASYIGRELAPRVMCDLDTGLTADAVDLLIDEDGCFVQTTPAYGGRFQAHIAIPDRRPQMVTVHQQVFSALEPDEGRQGRLSVENVEVERDDCYIVEEVNNKKPKRQPVTEASVLISGGRGLKSRTDLDMLGELAELLGGDVSCTRPLTDSGWLDHDRQLGQSGSTVKPDYIINVAISGSVQYISGIKNSGCIISVNHDDSAPIFEASDIGIVADYGAFIPAVIKEIKKRKGS